MELYLGYGPNPISPRVKVLRVSIHLPSINIQTAGTTGCGNLAAQVERLQVLRVTLSPGKWHLGWSSPPLSRRFRLLEAQRLELPEQTPAPAGWRLELVYPSHEQANGLPIDLAGFPPCHPLPESQDLRLGQEAPSPIATWNFTWAMDLIPHRLASGFCVYPYICLVSTSRLQARQVVAI